MAASAVLAALLVGQVLAQATPGTPRTAALDTAAKRKVIAQRAAMLKGFVGQTIPDPTPAIMEQADKIAAGTIFFYDRDPVQVGLKDIDWSGGHIKHQEWPAQLNRFFHLHPLAAAWQKTHDEKYALAARAYIEDWMNHGGSYETDQTFRPGDSTLNMSIRLGTSEHSGWGGVLSVFLDSQAFDDPFVERILASISSQARQLARNLSDRGNWRISELDALVFTAVRFPFLNNSDDLRRIGIQGMQNALASQFLPDGVHVERTPSYHAWMAEVALSYFKLARLLPEADAKVDPAVVARAFDYGAQSLPSGFNDSDFRQDDPARPEGLAERARARAVLFPGRAQKLPPLEQVFPDAGQVFVRSSWKPAGDYLAFDASSWGGPHMHLSRMGVTFRAGGRLLVADPGILNYEMSDPFAGYGKSTPAHSTLNLNGWNQVDVDGRLVRTVFTPEVAFIQGEYAGGYWPGQFTWGFYQGRGRGISARHQRVVFWVRGEYILVVDEMDAELGSQVVNSWQMAPMSGWKSDPATLSWWSTNKDTNLLVRMALPPSGTEMKCYEGSLNPRRGWVGLSGHDAQKAPQVEFQYPSAYTVASAVLLAPFKGETRPDYQSPKALQIQAGYARNLQLTLPDGSSDRFSWGWKFEIPVEQGDITSDARFVWLRRDRAGKPLKCFVIDGSYLRQNGKEVFAEKSRKTRFVRLGAAATGRTR